MSEIGDTLGVPRSAAHRLLADLKATGYVKQDPVTSHYLLTVRLAALGLAFLAGKGITDLAQPVLDESTALSAPSLVLQSEWGSAAVAGDAISVASAGGAAQASISSTAQAGGNTDAGVAVALAAGDVITFPAPTYTGTGNYTTTLRCVNDGTPTVALAGTAFPYTLTIAATTGAVVCTYVSALNVPAPVPATSAWALAMLASLMLLVARFVLLRRS